MKLSKTNVILVILLIEGLVFCGCKKQVSTTTIPQSKYFPVSDSLTTKYIYGHGSFRSINIISIINSYGKWYRITETSNSGAFGETLSTVYLRPNNSGNVERLILNIDYLRKDIQYDPPLPSSGSSLWYKFDAKDGESWFAYADDNTFPKGATLFRITLKSKHDTLRLDKQMWIDCILLGFEKLTESHGEYYEILSKGEGIIWKGDNVKHSGFVYRASTGVLTKLR